MRSELQDPEDIAKWVAFNFDYCYWSGIRVKPTDEKALDSKYDPVDTNDTADFGDDQVDHSGMGVADFANRGKAGSGMVGGSDDLFPSRPRARGTSVQRKLHTGGTVEALYGSTHEQSDVYEDIGPLLLSTAMASRNVSCLVSVVVSSLRSGRVHAPQTRPDCILRMNQCVSD